MRRGRGVDRSPTAGVPGLLPLLAGLGPRVTVRSQRPLPAGARTAHAPDGPGGRAAGRLRPPRRARRRAPLRRGVQRPPRRGGRQGVERRARGRRGGAGGAEVDGHPRRVRPRSGYASARPAASAARRGAVHGRRARRMDRLAARRRLRRRSLVRGRAPRREPHARPHRPAPPAAGRRRRVGPARPAADLRVHGRDHPGGTDHQGRRGAAVGPASHRLRAALGRALRAGAVDRPRPPRRGLG